MSVSPRVLQQPLVIAQPTPVHYRPSRAMLRGPRRASEPNKVPRPRNAFIIFRCLKIAQLHSRDASGSDRPPTPEKTLSKRAGAAWRLLPDEEKQVYKEMAERERLEHQEKYPGYRYQPNRSKATKPRTSGPLSRRERVESLVLRAASSHGATHSSESDESTSASPISETSSPEPSEHLCIVDLSQQDSDGCHRRSASLPHLQIPNAHELYPFSRTYFISPTSCGSSPGPGPLRTSRRSSLAGIRSYSPSPSAVPPPECGFDLEYGGATVPYSAVASQSSSLSLPELLSLSECLALREAENAVFVVPQTPPSHPASDPGAEYLPAQTQADSLFHRRQRSNTAPSAILSPLNALSSSLGNWNGPVTATAAATAGLPAFTLTSADDGTCPPTTSPLTDGTVPYGDFFSQRRGSTDSNASLGLSALEIDIDRTPRRSDFPHHVQDDYPAHFANMSPTPDFAGGSLEEPSPLTAQTEYDLQSYGAGLQELDISLPYDIPAIPHAISPFEELDFSEFLCPGSY